MCQSADVGQNEYRCVGVSGLIHDLGPRIWTHTQRSHLDPSILACQASLETLHGRFRRNSLGTDEIAYL